MIRTFVAIDLPESVKQDLSQLQQDLKSYGTRVSWVKPSNIHITLKFLGDVKPEKIPEISRALASVAATTRPFRLQPKSCGAFPSLKRMRVLWVGLDGALQTLSYLQERIEAALNELGFEPENRRFQAHLTIGRVKVQQNLKRLQEAIIDRQSFQSEAFDVPGFVLYKSVLRPEGARYSPLDKLTFPDADESHHNPDLICE